MLPIAYVYFIITFRNCKWSFLFVERSMKNVDNVDNFVEKYYLQPEEEVDIAEKCGESSFERKNLC